jgi:hypothetical protein
MKTVALLPFSRQHDHRLQHASLHTQHNKRHETTLHQTEARSALRAEDAILDSRKPMYTRRQIGTLGAPGEGKAWLQAFNI